MVSNSFGSVLDDQGVSIMSCSNGELVEFFLSHRLSQNNHPSSLLRPQDERTEENEAIPSTSNGSVVSGSAGVSQTPCGDTNPVKVFLVDSADKFEDLFKQEFSDLSLQFDVTPNMTYHTFRSMMDEVFKDGVNWGRVVGLFAFGGTLCVQCVEKDLSRMVPCISDWMTMYLDENLSPWIESQGGWETFAEVYGNHGAAAKKKSSGKMKKWLLVGGMLLTGVLLGVYIAKRR